MMNGKKKTRSRRIHAVCQYVKFTHIQSNALYCLECTCDNINRCMRGSAIQSEKRMSSNCIYILFIYLINHLFI